MGGFAHIIEDSRRYPQNKALEVLAGAIGHEYFNLGIPLRKDKAIKFVRDLKQTFNEFDWTKS